MKNRFYVARLGALALVLTLVTTCMMGGTLARYVSEVTGTGTAQVAKWSIKFKQGTTVQNANYDFTLAETKDLNNLVKNGTVAPGDTGSIDIEIDGTGTEVDYEYNIKLDKTAFTTTAANIKFYSDQEYKNEWDSDDEATTTVQNTADSKKITKKIYWKWEGTGNDTNDTTAGTDAAELTFTVKMTAQQKLAAAPTV